MEIGLRAEILEWFQGVEAGGGLAGGGGPFEYGRGIATIAAEFCDYGRGMSKFEGAMRRIEEVLERGEQHGLDLETLVQIEMAAAKLPQGPDVAPPQIRFNLYQNADLIHRAINICPARKVDILLCDLEESSISLPELKELTADPEFAEAWGFLMRVSNAHPVIDYRENALHHGETRPGHAVAQIEYADMIDPRPCLLLRPGRPSEEEYASYEMSSTTSYRDYMDTGA